MNILDILIKVPVINVLVAFYHAALYVHLPYALGFAIIALTVFIRLLLYPFTTSQMKMQKKMQEMAPHVAKIKEKHKGDMKAQHEAQAALYKEHGLSFFGGCLPGAAQIVILLFGLYPALRQITALNAKNTVATINKLVYFPAIKLQSVWDTSFFGLPLTETPFQIFGIIVKFSHWQPIITIKSTGIGPLILFIPLATGILQLIQSKMMTPQAIVENKNLPVVAEKKAGNEDFMATFQKQSLYLFPIMLGVFSYQFSIGLSLYWNTFAIFGIIQQYLVSGWGGLGSLFGKKDN